VIQPIDYGKIVLAAEEIEEIQLKQNLEALIGATNEKENVRKDEVFDFKNLKNIQA